MAGEIGHVVVDGSGVKCRCGQRGCLEAVAAGPAISRAWPKGVNGTAATALFGAASDGDAAAEKVAGRIAGHLTTALIWLAATYDTEVIVLAGGVTGAGDPFLAAVREQVGRRGVASELAARRLRPEQVILARVEDPLGLGAQPSWLPIIFFKRGSHPQKASRNNEQPIRRNGMKKYRNWLLLAVVMAFVIAACGGGDGAATTTAGETATTQLEHDDGRRGRHHDDRRRAG